MKRVIKSAVQFGMEPPARELGDTISARWQSLNNQFSPLRISSSRLNMLYPFKTIKVEFEDRDGITQEWYIHNNEAQDTYIAYQNDEYENIQSLSQLFSKCKKYGYWRTLDEALAWLRKFAV